MTMTTTVKWNLTFQAHALLKGWGLFQVDSRGPLVVQRNDDLNRFESDRQALAHVRYVASHGDDGLYTLAVRVLDEQELKAVGEPEIDPAERGEAVAWISTQIMETIQPILDSETDRGDGGTATLSGDVTDQLAELILSKILSVFPPAGATTEETDAEANS